MHPQSPQPLLAIDENPRQSVAIVGCTRHSVQNRHRGEVAGMAHELDSFAGKLPEGISEVIDRSTQQAAQGRPARVDLLQRRFPVQFVQSRVRGGMRSNFQPSGYPLLQLLAGHERFAFLEILRVPAIVGSHGATHDITRGCKAVLLQKRRCSCQRVGISVIERESHASTRAPVVQSSHAFADGHASKPKAAHHPQLTLEFIRAHVQQFETRTPGWLRHVVVAKNG